MQHEYDPIVNVGEASEILGVTRQTLWRMHAKYNMIAPPSRFSVGKTGYLLSYLEQWKKDRAAESLQRIS